MMRRPDPQGQFTVPPVAHVPNVGLPATSPTSYEGLPPSPQIDLSGAARK
jgi:hypothetical protein